MAVEDRTVLFSVGRNRHFLIQCRRFAALCVLLVLAVEAAAAQGFYHKVQRNESLDSIARRYRVSAYEIAKANKLSVNVVPAAGTNLWIPGTPPAAAVSTAPARATPTPTPKPKTVASAPKAKPGQYRVQPGDSLWKVARDHGSTVEAIAAANGLSTRSGLEVGQILTIPEKGATNTPGGGDFRETTISAPVTTTKSTSSTNTRTSKHGYIWPVQGRILQEFKDTPSSKHSGIDIAVAPGTEVKAAKSGTVIYAGNSISAYGNMIIIRHDNNWASCYAYNSKLLVRVDQQVKQGQTIALSGDSGKLEKPTLHFQLRKNGDAVNPKPYLP